MRSASLLLLLLLRISVAETVVANEQDDETDLPQRVAKPMTSRSDVLLASCSVGVAAAGAMLCGGVAAAGGYLAAGASGLGMTLALRQARHKGQENRALRMALGSAEGEEEVAALAEINQKQEEMRVASSAAVSKLNTLWRAMKGGQERMASSIDGEQRKELLELMRSLDSAADPYFQSEGEMMRAEHYLLRAFPHKEEQEVLLTAARASSAFSQLEKRRALELRDGGAGDDPALLPR